MIWIFFFFFGPILTNMRDWWGDEIALKKWCSLFFLHFLSIFSLHFIRVKFGGTHFSPCVNHFEGFLHSLFPEFSQYTECFNLWSSGNEGLWNWIDWGVEGGETKITEISHAILRHLYGGWLRFWDWKWVKIAWFNKGFNFPR